MDSSKSSSAWQGISDLLRSTEPHFEFDLAYCRAHPPDPKNHPATAALIAEYVKRLEIQLAKSRMGVDGIKELARDYPDLQREIGEIEQWIKRLKPNVAAKRLSPEDEDTIGNWLMKNVDPSFSKAKQFVDAASKSLTKKGAPSKRIETLKMLDARIASGWSYSILAKHMCDCGAREHGALCSERVRKRIKELENFLYRLGINLKPATPGKK